MAGLDDINPNDPAGTESPTLGDDRIRALAAKIIEAFEVEHDLAGPHTIKVGSSAQRPAAGYKGRFYILTAAGVAVELQYDTGAAWVFLTSNQTIIDYAAGLAAHIAASPIDHPNGSITQIKIAQGAILKKHLDGSGDSTTLEKLVDGSIADSLHIHSATDQNLAIFTSSGTWTCPDGITLLLFEGSGGGGGGGGKITVGGSVGGSGGGGGGYVKGYYTVVPGTDYNVVIGLGGGGGIVNVDGIAGGQTSFDASIIAYGGGLGKKGDGGGGAGGGFTVGGGFYGENGVAGTVGGPNIGDGGPGGKSGGFGGVGGAKGVNGTIPGGGGGGGYWSSIEYPSGQGARGLAILRW